MNCDNPDHLIGGESVKAFRRKLAEQVNQQVDRAKDFTILNFDTDWGRERYLLIFGDPYADKPVVCHYFPPPGITRWVLDDDPGEWRWLPYPVIDAVKENQGTWGMLEFTSQMSMWPPASYPMSEEHRQKIGGHYVALALWIRLYFLENSSKKEQLRELLEHTDLSHLQPYAELSMARLDFAYELYSRSKLAQRAHSETHLWFAMEYSNCLQKFHWLYNPVGPGIDDSRTNTTHFVHTLKHALKTGDFDTDNLLTIEQLKAEGADWRLHIDSLMQQEALKVYWEDPSELSDLEHCYKRYLDAQSSYNSIVGHKKEHQIFIDSNQTLTTTCKGKKRPGQPKPKRGRGRPPKGQSVKNN